MIKLIWIMKFVVRYGIYDLQSFLKLLRRLIILPDAKDNGLLVRVAIGVQ